MSCLAEPKFRGEPGSARTLWGSCSPCPLMAPGLAAAVEFRSNCSFASRALEPRKPPSWGKVFSVIYLFWQHRSSEVMQLFTSTMFSGRGVMLSEAQQESCAPAHNGATWMGWGVLATDTSSTGTFASGAMKRWLSSSSCTLPGVQRLSRASC